MKRVFRLTRLSLSSPAISKDKLSSGVETGEVDDSVESRKKGVECDVLVGNSARRIIESGYLPQPSRMGAKFY